MAIGFGVAAPKGETRKRMKGRADRAEAKVKTSVRAECVLRDGYCRLAKARYFAGVFGDHVATTALNDGDSCAGPSQWCHMHIRRRSQTRNLAPDIRHDSTYSFMACEKHHDQYDGRQKPRLLVTALSANGADGPLKFRRGKS